MRRENLDINRIILISIFLSIFVVGTFFIFTTPSSIKIRYNLTVETKDNEQISFNVYEPIENDKKMKAIIIGHGIMVNKEMLKDFAIEIATAGFTVVTCDFRGHGLSSGKLDSDKLDYDIKAIKEYLISRGDIDDDDFGYIGYSMGGLPGNEIVKDDLDFKCFIGIGTSLGLDYEDCKNRELNILMILAKYDQGFDLKGRKEEIAERVNIDDEDVHVNKLYGSFENGNATMLFLDDNSDHFTTAYDQDFIREARDWIINTFPEVEPVDEDFYVNLRPWFLILQLLGGIGFLFLIIDPLSKLILKPKEDLVLELKTDEETITTLSLKTIIFSMALAIPGMLIILLTVFLFLPISIAGFSMAILFGMVFGIFILLWRIGRKNNVSIKDIIIDPFRESRERLIRQIVLGAILASILYTILYLSIGLNYLGIIPSLYKLPWLPIYLVIGFFMFFIVGRLFQTVIQVKFEKGLKNLFKAAILQYSFVMLYFVSYILIICILLRTFFFTMFFYFAVPMFLLAVFISSLLYQKTDNIIAATIVNTVFFILIISTLSPFMSGLEMIALFGS